MKLYYFFSSLFILLRVEGSLFSFCFLIGYDSIAGVFSLPHITHQIWEGSGELDCLFSHCFSSTFVFPFCIDSSLIFCLILFVSYHG